ncbi:MAG: hypothetical protein GY800_08890 [Planctomycetes bacterium]|nr:hypothetical protein [Planctomycetota bacterium]
MEKANRHHEETKADKTGTIKITVEPGFYGSLNIEGYVDGMKVASVNRYEDRWTVTGSSCLPSDIKLAEKYLECMNRAFNERERFKEKR